MFNFSLNSNPGYGGGYPLSGGGFPGGMTTSPLDASTGMMMSAMSMMSGMLMMMVSGMMTNLTNGQMPMSVLPGQFGGGMAGSPLNGFLGGGGGGKAGKFGKSARRRMGSGGEQGRSAGASGASGSPGSSSASNLGPAASMDSNGKVGNVNVGKMINAIDSGYRPYARKHWPSIVAEAQKQGIKSKAELAYILATTVHESGAGKYMEEIASGSAYEGRSDLGNTHRGDGVRFKGRGYVQITGRNNYTKWGKKLGINLVGNPELAERPAVAAKILVGGMKEGSFTGRGLDDYFGKGKADFVGARAIVNGSDKASTFASTARAIMSAM